MPLQEHGISGDYRRRKAADAAAGAQDLRRLSAQEGGGRRCWSTGSQETVDAEKQRMPLSIVVIIRPIRPPQFLHDFLKSNSYISKNRTISQLHQWVHSADLAVGQHY
jgi:hypothetical protein